MDPICAYSNLTQIIVVREKFVDLITVFCTQTRIITSAPSPKRAPSQKRVLALCKTAALHSKGKKIMHIVIFFLQNYSIMIK